MSFNKIGGNLTMKKTLLGALLFLPLVAMSQSLRYGICVGIMPSTTVSEPHHFTGTGAPEGFTSRTTYNVGATAIYFLGRDFSLNAAIQYTSKSVSTHRQGLADGDVLATLHFNYLRFAPRLQYNPFGNFVIVAGHLLDISLNNSLNASGDWPANQTPIPSTKDYRLGGLFSIGHLIEISSSIVILPVISYDLGFSTTNEVYGKRYSSTEISLSILLN
jgi:hypothetical protein